MWASTPAELVTVDYLASFPVIMHQVVAVAPVTSRAGSRTASSLSHAETSVQVTPPPAHPQLRPSACDHHADARRDARAVPAAGQMLAPVGA